MILRTSKRLGDVRRRNGQRAGDAARGIRGDHVCLTLSTMSCGTPCMMQKLAICLHPAHLICAPGGLAIKAQTVLHPLFIIAARKRESRTSIPFSRSHKARRGGQSAADTPQKKKSLPVRQHGQAKRVMSFADHHNKNTTTCGKPQGGKT